MKSNPSLRQRIVLGVVCFTVFIALASSLLGFWVNEKAEQRVWEDMLQSELHHHIVNRVATSVPSTDDKVLVYGGNTGRSAPEEFAALGPGVHDEVKLAGSLYVVAVDGGVAARTYLAIDISESEHREEKLAGALAVGAAVLLAILALVTYLGAQWLVRPLTKLSDMISGLTPGERGQRIAMNASDPKEVAVISQALNTYLHDIDHYVEREREFLNVASHELRTPIAVISGAAEVASEQNAVELARPHISRIIQASNGMRDLLALLLALARDPARLHASGNSVDLAVLVLRIAADHEHLLAGKELTITYGRMPSAELRLPDAIATATIGNLIRNAIENSNRGTILISADSDGALIIEDPGSAMSAQEQSQLQAKLARAGHGHGNGIGLDLVVRLCRHLGWTLSLLPKPMGGTVATLRFSGSRSLPADVPSGR